jgi:hypothetical protein
MMDSVRASKGLCLGEIRIAKGPTLAMSLPSLGSAAESAATAVAESYGGACVRAECGLGMGRMIRQRALPAMCSRRELGEIVRRNDADFRAEVVNVIQDFSVDNRGWFRLSN